MSTWQIDGELPLVAFVVQIALFPARFCTGMPQVQVTTTFANKLMEPVLGARLRMSARVFALSSSADCLLGCNDAIRAFDMRVSDRVPGGCATGDNQTA
jgi:hypothetical protein